MLSRVLELRSTNPSRFGVMLALLGVFILSPDTLVMRLSALEPWPLVGSRGVLMGAVLLVIWWCWLAEAPMREWRTVATRPGLIVVIAFGLNSITFTLGVAETSVTIVLTAVATMPVFAAVLSTVMLNERQGWVGWGAIAGSIAGVAVVVSDGTNATGAPDGSPVLGALYGMLTAFGLALTFTVVRKYPDLSVLPAVAVGALASGALGLALSGFTVFLYTPVWCILTMGALILPLSFTCLNIAPRYTTAATVSLVMLLEMVIGPFCVWLGVGERPTGTMVMGATFVTLALIVYVVHAERALNR